MSVNVSVDTSVDLNDLADQLTWQLTNEQLIEFFVRVDECMASSSFTAAIAKRFKQLKKGDAHA